MTNRQRHAQDERDEHRAERNQHGHHRGSRQTPDRFAPIEGCGGHVIGNPARLLSRANRSLQFNLGVVPKVPFPQDLFERAVANDLVDGRVDVRLQLLVAFRQPDVISAPRKRFARGFEFRIRARVIHFHRHVHEHGVDALELEIAISSHRIGIAAPRDAILLHEPRRRGVSQSSDHAIVTIGERANPFFIASNRQLQLENIIGIAEINLLRAVSGGFESVHDYVERAALESRHERLPI